VVIKDARVEPTRLRLTGYRFRFQTLEDALRHLLGKPRARAAPA
jgi:NAD dependent epimerase/dehydratase family enzyme